MLPDRDQNLDRELRDLGLHVEYPPAPDLAGSVRSRLETEAGGSGSPARSGPQLWWIAAAALVLLVAVPAFSLVIQGMGGGALSVGGGAAGGGAAVESGDQGANGGSDAVEEARTVLAPGVQEDEASFDDASSGATAMAIEDGGGGVGSARGGASGKSLGLGQRLSLRQAGVRAEAPILLPGLPEVQKPDEVYARRGDPGAVSVYRANADRTRSGLPIISGTNVVLILTQTPDEVGESYLLPAGTTERTGLEKVSVGGYGGYWIPPSGNAPRVARTGGLLAGVLLWERDGQALRIEAEVSKEEAVRIAESVR